MGTGFGAIIEGIINVANAMRGDVSDPLTDIAQQAKSAELGDDNAFSEYLADLVPPALKQFDQNAEAALNAMADFAAAMAEGLEAAQESYDNADRDAANELTRLTEEL